MSAVLSQGYAERLASPHEKTALAAVVECARALRSGDVDLDRIQLAEDLCALLDHGSPEVRQEIAAVCDTFPEPFFSAALERLTADVDRFVQSAAKHAGERRARLRKERRVDETREEVLEGILTEIEDAPRAQRRVLAERAVRRGVEHFVGRLDHEVRKSDRSIDRALAALDAEIEAEAPSRAALRVQAATLREHFDFIASMIRRGREYAAQVRPVLAEESLAEVVEIARRQLGDRLGPRAAALAFAAAIDGEIRLQLDRGALLQALQNVFQNAVEAYPASCETMPIHVSAAFAMAGAQVELKVRDQGRGIGKEGLAKLYLPFGSSKPGGTGVGMLIVRTMIAEVHEGELVVESEPGVGTTVTMRLPVAARGRTATPDGPAAARSPRSRTRKGRREG